MAGDPVRGGVPSSHDDQMPLAYLASASAVGFWDWNMVTNSLILSSEWKRQIGYEPHEIPDRLGEWDQRIHPDDLAHVLARLQAYLDHPQGLYENEFRLRHKNGSYRWILARGEVVRDDSGQPIRMVGCHIDVTERKDAEREVDDSRRHYADLVRSINGIIWEADARTFEFLYVSDAARDLLGYPLERWLTPGFWADHIHPDDRTRAVQYCVDSTARGEAHEFEYRMMAADGRTVWLRDLVSVVLGEDGPRLLRGLMVDITRQKEVERQLEREHASLQLSMDLAQLGSWELDLTTGQIAMNDRMLQILGTSAAAEGGHVMAGAAYRDRFLTPEGRRQSAEGMAEAMQAADASYTRQIEHPIVRADGTQGFVTMRYGIVKDASGRTIRGRGVAQDITERKQTELRLTRLLQGESLLASLSQSFIEMELAHFDQHFIGALRAVAEFGSFVRAALFIYAADGKRVINSHEWCADPADSLIDELRETPVGQFAWFRQELTALRTVCIESEADIPYDSVEAAWGRERGFRSTILLPLTSKSRLIGVLGFYGPVHARRTFDQDLRQLLASFATSVANLVSRKAADDERAGLERQLLQAQKMEAIGTLAGGIAHDFNNILSAIVGNLGLARLEHEEGRPIGDSLLEIERASERARALVQQILAFSRQQEHERQIVALAPLVTEAISLIRATIPATVSIDAVVADDAPDVLADQTQIHQILMNLCANAWHAMEDRPGTIVVSLDDVTVPADQAARMGVDQGRYARLSVRDNGRGMDAETLARVFDPFFTTKIVGKGTGLGMSVVHGIVRSHMGGIAIDSDVGRGTTVSVFFPAAVGTAAVIPPQPTTATGNGERILLVDDEEAIVKVMTRILERLGYQVVPFTSAIEALGAFRSDLDGFDLVISDFEMPDATGLELAKVIHGEHPKTPVILCSGRYRADASVEPDAGTNVRRLITKPCTAGVLSRVVRDVLDERHR